MTSWPKLFVDAIGSLQPRMRLAMTADGSREAWLQTEVMMYAAGHGIDVWTNCEPVRFGARSRGSKYDWAAYRGDKPAMVAEVKIMSGAFLPKSLLGRRANQWRGYAGRRHPIVISEEEIGRPSPGDWGLFADAARLLWNREVPKRYLVLVLLDMPIDDDVSARVRHRRQNLHSLMGGVTFVRKPVGLRAFRGFMVKVWGF